MGKKSKEAIHASKTLMAALLRMVYEPVLFVQYAAVLVGTLGLSLWQIWGQGWLTAGVIGTLVSFGTFLVRDAGDRVVRKRAHIERTFLSDTLAPISQAVAEMVSLTPGKRVERLSTIAEQCVYATLRLEPTEGVRVCVYLLNEDGDGLDPIAWKANGHRHRPNPFVPLTPRTLSVLKLLASGRHRFEDDIAGKALSDYEGSGDGYNTFISMPIQSTGNAFGLLTMDAITTDDLTESNVNDLRLVAAVLAPAVALVTSSGRAATNPSNVGDAE
ncbi:hypothetical protein [Microbacterium sp. GXF7504]